VPAPANMLAFERARGEDHWMAAAVTGLATTVFKGTRLRPAPVVTLESGGARGDRRFYAGGVPLR
jgi:hypothetical protein